ncbi:MAG: HNH endonuclease [Bacteroidales bacterium]|nr:HNH endonuclease [Candidatus Physcousia equi]
MPNSKKKNRCIATSDIQEIKSSLEFVSPSMINYIEGAQNSEFILRYKSITHSDLANSGKRNGPKEPLEKNFLYYLSNDEMHRIESQSDTCFETAKQSNIGMPESFFDDLGVPHPRSEERKAKGTLCLNDYVEVKLVNDSMSFFTEGYTRVILEKLGKKIKWENKSLYSLDDGDFTDIRLSEAVHGIGTSTDSVFAKIRLSIFLNDTIYFLIEKNASKDKRVLYILLEKNPIFYTLAGISNQSWVRFLSVNKRQKNDRIESQSSIEVEEEKSRKKQSAWKKQLAKEMMNFTTHEGEVFCPLTYTTANFEDVSMLFIASHIKRFADSECEEAYDINNGLLLCANADALFDKHMITITPEKELKFSFLIDNDKLLKKRLLLNQEIFTDILNEKRMEYLLDHNKIFEEKERQRKSVGYTYEDENDDSERNIVSFKQTVDKVARSTKTYEEHEDVSIAMVAEDSKELLKKHYPF